MKRPIETLSPNTLQRLSAVLLLILGLAATGCDMLDSNAVEDEPHTIHTSQGLYEDIQPLGPPAEAPGDEI